MLASTAPIRYDDTKMCVLLTFIFSARTTLRVWSAFISAHSADMMADDYSILLTSSMSSCTVHGPLQNGIKDPLSVYNAIMQTAHGDTELHTETVVGNVTLRLQAPPAT